MLMDPMVSNGPDDSPAPHRVLRGSDYMEDKNDIFAAERDLISLNGNGFRLVCNARRKQC